MLTIRRAHAARMQGFIALAALSVALVACSGGGRRTAEAVVVARPTAAPSAEALTRQLDEAWQREDWTSVLVSLDQLERVAPKALNFRDKRYAAHIAAGEALVSLRDYDRAADEFARAQRLDPARSEASDAMLTLTSTLMARLATPKPDYRYLGAEATSLPNRPRYRVNIVIPQGADREVQTMDFVDAVNRAFGEHRDAKAVVVFGYSSVEATSGPFDVGRAFASDDRLGWAGNGLVGFGSAERKDDGKIYLSFNKGGTTGTGDVEAAR
jgi:hypothetical protein